MQDSFIEFGYSQEADYYCLDDHDTCEEIPDEFKNSSKKVGDFKPFDFTGFWKCQFVLICNSLPNSIPVKK